MTHRLHLCLLVVSLVAASIAAVLVVTAGSAAASTDEDGANWVPFVGDYELWCTQGNPGYSGCQRHHNRPAMDIGMPPGTTIRAAGTGTVREAGNNGDGRGVYVVITHEQGRTSHYYHLSSVSVSAGQAVVAGDVIGRSGNTGSTSAPHLHYEEKDSSGRTVEPGVMHSLQGGRLVDYPTAGGSSDWLRVPYGTRIVNEGYDVPLFVDVSPATWNYTAVEWAVEAGVASGFPDGTFRNGDPLSRAQAVTWVWKTAGRPPAAASAPHPDVPQGAWYRAALDWAAGVPGMLDQFGPEFGPGTTITRGQLAVMLWSRAGRPAAPSIGFTDVTLPDEISAADWIAARRYMRGYADGTFRPGNDLTRGETVSALWKERLFDDVTPTAWNRPAVDWARWRAFMVGFPDHTFRAPNSITRAQTVMMLWRAAGSPAPATSAGYVDVAPGSWYAAAADWAAETGVATGYPDGTFRGDETIKRQAFVRMLYRQAGAPVPASLHPFTDILAGAWYEDAASWAAENAVVTGIRGEFQGGAAITRGQSVNSFNMAASLAG